MNDTDRADIEKMIQDYRELEKNGREPVLEISGNVNVVDMSATKPFKEYQYGYPLINFAIYLAEKNGLNCFDFDQYDREERERLGTEA